MNLLFLFYFLLPLASQATLKASAYEECYHFFANTNKNIQNNLKAIEEMSLIDFLNSQNLLFTQKQVAVKFLSHLTPQEIILVFDAILDFEKSYQKKLHNSIFMDTLMDATQKQIPNFRKNQLIYIIYFLKEIGLKPSETFIFSWRQASLKKRKEFRSFDRYLLGSLFKQIGILPLQNPYKLNGK